MLYDSMRNFFQLRPSIEESRVHVGAVTCWLRPNMFVTCLLLIK